MGFLARPIRYSFLAKDLRNNRQSGGLNGQVTTAFVRSYGENNSEIYSESISESISKNNCENIGKTIGETINESWNAVKHLVA
jgi:hypothetical protein